MRTCVLISIMFIAACSSANRTKFVQWEENMLWGQTLDVMGDNGHLGFIAIFASQPERKVYAKQRSGGATTLLGPIFVGTWQVTGGWLIFTDDKGRVQEELLLLEQRGGYFYARRHDGTETRVAYLQLASSPTNLRSQPD